MSKESHPVPIPPRPSLKRSFTSILSRFSRKPSVRVPQRASSWDSNRHPPSGHPGAVEFAPPQPYHRTPRPQIEIVESGGSALSEAQDAFTNSRRAVWTRMLWTVPLEHDPGAQMVLSKITKRDAVEGLSLLAVGAAVLRMSESRDYRNISDSRTLEVDWITFRDTQKTREKALQREVLRNEPALSTLVYAFRLLPDKRSVAIWRRKIDIPATILRKNANAIAAKRRELRVAEAQYVIKISPPSKEWSDESGLHVRHFASLPRHGIRV
ncbi:hypothetical protein FRC11_011488 [Ceratobasidium sp. 423]|nr:hypothetical protein FRC11_011488 [Ceratobasidium sp. 423]